MTCKDIACLGRNNVPHAIPREWRRQFRYRHDRQMGKGIQTPKAGIDRDMFLGLTWQQKRQVQIKGKS